MYANLTLPFILSRKILNCFSFLISKKWFGCQDTYAFDIFPLLLCVNHLTIQNSHCYCFCFSFALYNHHIIANEELKEATNLFDLSWHLRLLFLFHTNKGPVQLGSIRDKNEQNSILYSNWTGQDLKNWAKLITIDNKKNRSVLVLTIFHNLPEAWYWIFFPSFFFFVCFRILSKLQILRRILWFMMLCLSHILLDWWSIRKNL